MHWLSCVSISRSFLSVPFPICREYFSQLVIATDCQLLIDWTYTFLSIERSPWMFASPSHFLDSYFFRVVFHTRVSKPMSCESHLWTADLTLVNAELQVMLSNVVSIQQSVKPIVMFSFSIIASLPSRSWIILDMRTSFQRASIKLITSKRRIICV